MTPRRFKWTPNTLFILIKIQPKILSRINFREEADVNAKGVIKRACNTEGYCTYKSTKLINLLKQ